MVHLVWTEDLNIRDFFADSSSPLPGQGFIETIGIFLVLTF
jgi:hypothetical protein